MLACMTTCDNIQAFNISCVRTIHCTHTSYNGQGACYLESSAAQFKTFMLLLHSSCGRGSWFHPLGPCAPGRRVWPTGRRNIVLPPSWMTPAVHYTLDTAAAQGRMHSLWSSKTVFMPLCTCTKMCVYLLASCTSSQLMLLVVQMLE